MTTDVDPDDGRLLPIREFGATLALIHALSNTLDSVTSNGEALDVLDALTSQLSDYLRGADHAYMLNEVGPLEDTEGLRLFLHRLHERIAARAVGVPTLPALEPPPVTIPPRSQALGGIPIRRVSASSAIIDDPLAEWFVWWDDIEAEDVASYETALDAAQGEREMQRYIARHPVLLAQHLGGGHGRWVIPQKRLGADFVTDFVIAERDSAGFSWQFVELQDPRAKLFVPSSGRTSDQFDEGIRQILEWRRWLEGNRDYARRPRHENGLGLTDVGSRDPGIIIIGRERDLSPEDKVRRKQLAQDHAIGIHTYDWLIRSARGRVESLRRFRAT